MLKHTTPTTGAEIFMSHITLLIKESPTTKLYEVLKGVNVVFTKGRGYGKRTKEKTISVFMNRESREDGLQRVGFILMSRSKEAI